jgi:hypothetical protein
MGCAASTTTATVATALPSRSPQNVSEEYGDVLPVSSGVVTLDWRPRYPQRRADQEQYTGIAAQLNAWVPPSSLFTPAPSRRESTRSGSEPMEFQHQQRQHQLPHQPHGQPHKQ